MALTLESGSSIQRWRALSTDPKPGEPGVDDDRVIKVGSIITETDTGERYVWLGGWPWVRQAVTLEVLFADLMAVNEEVLRVLRLVQRATATTANELAATDYPTDDE